MRRQVCTRFCSLAVSEVYRSQSESYSLTVLVVLDNAQALGASAVDILVNVALAVKDNGLRFLLLTDAGSLNQVPVLAPLLALEDWPSVRWLIPRARRQAWIPWLLRSRTFLLKRNALFICT